MNGNESTGILICSMNKLWRQQTILKFGPSYKYIVKHVGESQSYEVLKSYHLIEAIIN